MADSVDVILDFLRRNNFTKAEEALRSEINASSDTGGTNDLLLTLPQRAKQDGGFSREFIVKQIEEVGTVTANSNLNSCERPAEDLYPLINFNAKSAVKDFNNRFISARTKSRFDNGYENKTQIARQSLDNLLVKNEDDNANAFPVKTMLPFHMANSAPTSSYTGGSSSNDENKSKKNIDSADIKEALPETTEHNVAENHREEYPRLPPVRLRSVDKVAEMSWEENLDHHGVGEVKDSVFDGSYLTGSFLDVPVGQEINNSEYGTKNGLGRIGAGIRVWSNINPNLLLFVFLPPLLFESSFAMEIHQIKKCMVQMLLLAGPGVVISTFCLGSALKVTHMSMFSFQTYVYVCLAVVALLKDLGASKELTTIIEGESLMNDGTAIVVYQVFYKMVFGESFNAGEIIKFLSQVSLGAVALGIAFGIASVLWLGFIFDNTVIKIALTLAVSYLTFFTAQDGAEVSGVLAVMSLGMFYAAVARTAFKGESRQSLHHFWDMVAYIANTLVFILSGVVIAEGVLHNYSQFEQHGMSWGYLFLLYVFVQLSRVIVVGILYPLLKSFGHGFNWKEAVILIWSGLRGVVALALSLSVKRASNNGNQSYLKPEVGILFLFLTGGIVFLTIVINGSTTKFFLRLLSMDKFSPREVRVLICTRDKMLNMEEAFCDLGDDEELGPADWSTVQRYITCLNDSVKEEIRSHCPTEGESDFHIEMELQDIRIRFLNGVKASYWQMLDEGRITQKTANLLMQSVDKAMVLVFKSLCDWKSLKSHVHFPSYYRILQIGIFPQRLVTYFKEKRLESSCSICAAFLRAHRIAQTQLRDFLGGNVIVSEVIDESNLEGEEARKFLEDVRADSPQVISRVNTRQVTYSILKQLSEYVQNLEKIGLLEDKEMLPLDKCVQKEMKKLLRRNPP